MWLLEFERQQPLRPDPLTGWNGSGDTNPQVRITFPSKEAAIAYCDKHGLNIMLSPPPGPDEDPGLRRQFSLNLLHAQGIPPAGAFLPQSVAARTKIADAPARLSYSARADDRWRRHRRAGRGGAACPAATPNCLSPSSADPALALGQRAHRLRHADERADDLQRPSPPLLGPVSAPTSTIPGCRFTAGRFPGWATIPSTYNLAAARRWHLAFAWLLALGLIALPDHQPHQPPRPARPRAAPRRGAAAATSGRTSGSMRGCASRPARRRSSYNMLQKLSYVGGDLRAAAADGADRPRHVAGDGRGLAVAARPVRRAPVGALDPLHLRDADRWPSSSSTW